MGQRDLRNQREGASEMETLGSRFSALKGLDNLELKDDARDKMISGDAAAKLKGNEKMVARNSGKGQKATDSRLDGLLGKMNAIMGQNQDRGGLSFPTNSAGRKSKLGREFRAKGINVFGQQKKRNGFVLEVCLAKWQAKGGGPRGDATGLNSAGLNLAKNSHENSVEINYGPNSEGMVVVLDGNVLDLGKHSMVIFKETPNPNKGEVLRDRGDDEVGKEVPTPKV
ncbi:hypothetical protein Gogos_009049 [Gossypium gossypioides]|uniref:Uncharacterized protein n=1 Tax=Gossypium gossypioides TaxID=34282 RepID=A0A7J9CDL3_GOSGO|nr:hypothetical protein [Gossypium gossypioides]